LVVVGDAFQDSSSRKYCKLWLAQNVLESRVYSQDLRSFLQTSAPRP
jgi:hypothetical protein